MADEGINREEVDYHAIVDAIEAEQRKLTSGGRPSPPRVSTYDFLEAIKQLLLRDCTKEDRHYLPEI